MMGIKKILQFVHRKKFMWILFFLINNFATLGQELSDQANYRLPTFSPSPNVTAINKYLDQPINLSTGIPEIDIPLYNIQIGDIQLPIGLNYYAGGVKVSQEASQVGLNWSLNAGGVVSREIRGIIDDLQIQGIEFGGLMYSTKSMKYILGLNPFDPHSELYEISHFDTQKQTDYQADLFTYVLPIGGAQFVINEDDKIFYELERTNNKLEYKTGSAGRIYEWTITDPKGVKYIFGEISNTETAFSNPQFSETNYRTIHGSNSIIADDGASDPIGITSWYLREIIDVKGNVVNFEYGTNLEVEYLNRTPEIANGAYFSIGQIYSKTILKEKYLSKISFNGGYAEFFYNNRVDIKNSKKLNKIEIYRTNLNSNELIKQISLHHSYHNYSTIYEGRNHPSFDQNYKRLKLDSITIRGGLQDNHPMIYKFDYDDTPLPAKFSNAKDYWDGFNGENNINTFPEVVFFNNGTYTYVNAGNKDVKRHVNKDFVTAGTLTKITYPTGGYTKYYYEPNSVTHYTHLGHPLAGSNASSTIHWKNIKNPPLIKTYNFTSLPTSGQWVNCPFSVNGHTVNFRCPITIDYPLQSSFDFKFEQQVPGSGNNYQVVNYHFSCPEGSVQEPSNQYPSEGEIVCNYRPARITYLNGEEVPNWLLIEPGEYFVEIPFNGNPSLFDENSTVKSSFDLSLEIRQDKTPEIRVVGGLRVSKIENYDNNKLISKRDFEYEFKEENENIYTSSGNTILPTYGIYDVIYLANEINYGGMNIKELYAISDYNLNPLSKGNIAYHKVKENIYNVDELSSSMEKKYSTLHIFNNKIYRHYDTIYRNEAFGNEFIFKEMLLKWNNKKITEKFYDNIGNVIEENNYTNLLNTTNDIKILGGIYIFPMNFKLGTSILQHKLVIDYHEYSSFSQLLNQENINYSPNDLIVNKIDYSYSINNPLLVSAQTTTNSLGETLKTEYYYPQDLLSNYEQSGLMHKLLIRNQISSPIITKSFNGTTPLSEQRTHFTHEGENPSNPLDGMILPKYIYAKKGEIGSNSQLEDRKITYDKYDENGNLLQYTLENGIPVSILWGYNKQYPIAKVEGLAYDSISSSIISNLTSKSNNNTLVISDFNTLRSIEGALVTSYVYKPLVGVSSIMQPNGQVENYEYDSGGKLYQIKDEFGQIIKQIEYNYRD